MDVKNLSTDEIANILQLAESYFVDLKAKAISPAKLSRTISAFSNASGGEIYVGVEESENSGKKTRTWVGFSDQSKPIHFFKLLMDLTLLEINSQHNFFREVVRKA